MVVNLQPMEEGSCLVVSVTKICTVEDKGFLGSCGLYSRLHVFNLGVWEVCIFIVVLLFTSVS